MDIRLINVSKNYRSSEGHYIQALNMVNIDINYQSYVSFLGPTGSGKSTLLNIITGILKPSTGDVYWGKHSLMKSSDAMISANRRKSFGIVFQEPRFVPELTVEENILLPLVINAIDIASKKDYYLTLLEKLQITALRNRLPYNLSGGEKRKVTIARALISNPDYLIADEPTSNLDDGAAQEVFNIFYNLNRLGLTVLVATHDERFAKYARETYFLSRGSIENYIAKPDEKPSPTKSKE